jgi:hypothetical protein
VRLASDARMGGCARSVKPGSVFYGSKEPAKEAPLIERQLVLVLERKKFSRPARRDPRSCGIQQTDSVQATGGEFETRDLALSWRKEARSKPSILWTAALGFLIDGQ